MSPQPITFDVESYFDEFADKSAMAEAARFRTIPSGSYQFQASKREGIYLEQTSSGYWKRVFSETGEVKPEWRKGVRFSGAISKVDDPTKKLRTSSVDASWEAKRDSHSGEYDKYFKKWEQLTRALYPTLKAEERASKGVGEVIGASLQYPVKVYVSEAFQVPQIDGSNRWVTPKDPEQAKQFREAGYKADNFIQSISKIS